MSLWDCVVRTLARRAVPTMLLTVCVVHTYLSADRFTCVTC